MSDERVFAKCAWRLIPFMGLLYLVSFIDRTNAGFAAITMNKDLGFSPTVFGFGAGLFFVGYALCQVPGNLILERAGAKRWIFCILVVWGLLSASTALVQTPISFYAVRLFLGVAEAGFFPGMLLYLTYWFPRRHLARFTASFMVAIPLSYIAGGLLASLILGMDGIAGLHGWQWLFAIEGVPAVLLAFAVLKLLPDGPGDAPWLTDDERQAIGTSLASEDAPGRRDLRRELWQALSDSRVLALGVANFIFQSATYGVALWMPQIVQAMGFSTGATGVVVALIFVAGAFAMIAGGRSSSMRNERIWHVALPWLLTAGSLAVASAVQSNGVVLVAFAIAQIGFLGAQGTFFSVPSSFLRGTAAAAGIGVFNTLGSLGGFFGPFLIGVLREGSGDYATGIAAAAVGMLLTALIVLGVGRAMAARSAAMAPAAGGAE